jgi:hypothetical protein
MMKAHFYSKNRQIAVEVEGNLKEVFKQIATAQEVFDAESSCGCCNSTNIRFQHRNVDKNDFYEMVCVDCNARFQFGQAKEGGTLFPKRKEGKRGWDKYVKPAEKAA